MYFPTTQWSLLARASLGGETAAHDALEVLCRRYWNPIFQYLRAGGLGPEDSRELTQDFLRQLLAPPADPRGEPFQGRFRTFLLRALSQYLDKVTDVPTPAGRVADADAVSVADRSSFEFNLGVPLVSELPQENSPEAIAYDREWALVVLETALARVQEEYVGNGRGEMFAVLRHFLPGAVRPMASEDAAARLRLSAAALQAEILRMRQRFRSLVREEIAGTVNATHEIEEEMEHLRQALMAPEQSHSPATTPVMRR